MGVDSEVILTICIPTFNRGKKALNLVNTILPYMHDGLEILVLNNNSDKEVEEYNCIEDIALTNSYIKYIRHDVNRMAEGNVLACFEYAKSQYIAIMSDEDFPNMELIDSVLQYLESNPNIGMLRGSIQPMTGVKPANSFIFDDNYYKAGESALLNNSFTNNYLSGTIYNRQKVIEYKLYDLLKKNLEKYKVYPHIYLELLLASVCDISYISDVLSFEGEAQIIFNELGIVEGDSMEYKFPYSFGSRIDQFIVFRDAIYEVVQLVDNNFNIILFSKLYARLVNKYFFLIGRVNIGLYENVMLDRAYLLKSFYNFACSAILSDTNLEDFHDDLLDLINDCYKKYA